MLTKKEGLYYCEVGQMQGESDGESDGEEDQCNTFCEDLARKVDVSQAETEKAWE